MQQAAASQVLTREEPAIKIHNAADAAPVKEDPRQRIRRLTHACQAYKGADTARSLFEIATSAGPYFILCSLMIWGYLHGVYALPLLLMVPAAGFLVRLFIIQHDCGHGSFFKSRVANDTVGRLISVLTLTPYSFWRKTHNMHHASSGNLDRRGQGSIDTLTVSEYQALPARRQLGYRIYRNPFILLLLGIPFYTFVIHRFPPGKTTPFIKNYQSAPYREALSSILCLDAALLAVYGTAIYLLGWKAMVFAYFPAVLITSWIGGWLFFMQHQFEESFWTGDETWNFQEASLLGSSYYVLPRWLQWFTGNIGIHHVHHLCAMIPNYRLQKCLDDHQELREMNRMTLVESLQCVRWSLWDETQKRMVSFADLKTAS